MITGSTEADMSLHRISDESPVGAALIGHKAGDEVAVKGMAVITVSNEN